MQELGRGRGRPLAGSSLGQEQAPALGQGRPHRELERGLVPVPGREQGQEQEQGLRSWKKTEKQSAAG